MHILLCLLCVLCGASQAQKIRIKTGIEVLKDQNFKCLEGKRVGLITNPTGVDNQMKSTIDILHEAPNVNLVALFLPKLGSILMNAHTPMVAAQQIMVHTKKWR